MKKVLLLTDVNFWEGFSGNRTRIAALVEYLASRVQLTVINTGPAPADAEVELNKRYEAEFFVIEKVKYLNSNGYGRCLKSLFKSKQLKFDVVIIQYIHNSYFLNFLPKDSKVILDAHDIISDRAEEFSRFNYQGALYELTREDENQLINCYDHVMMLCQPDFDKVAAITRPGVTLLCPHPAIPSRREVPEQVTNVVFVASAYLPNKDAINYFIANCWDRILAKYPVNLLIYGTVGYDLVIPPKSRILCKGFVADIDKIYDEADIIINPVRFGAGLKIKNMEALAHGIPLVTTSHGARGLEPIKNKGFLVADDPDDFAKAICSLIESNVLRKKISECAQNYIMENFSPEKCFAPLMAVI
jgi:glycosyltransferase involved in cell wall biosynthesis